MAKVCNCRRFQKKNRITPTILKYRRLLCYLEK
jgi:hypothetical protein